MYCITMTRELGTPLQAMDLIFLTFTITKKAISDGCSTVVLKQMDGHLLGGVRHRAPNGAKKQHAGVKYTDDNGMGTPLQSMDLIFCWLAFQQCLIERRY